MSEIPRPEKILIAMLRLSAGSSRPLEYEDIVVQAWKLFPEDFGLRKYVRDHPDASDIHKPLYGPLKSRGLVLSGNKKFKLTDAGIAYAQELEKGQQGVASAPSADRLSRVEETELKRILDSDAFALYCEGSSEKVLDTDFYAYLGTTVRTKEKEFLGRLDNVAKAVGDAERLRSNPKHLVVAELHRFLCTKFAPIIERKKGRK